MTGFRAALMAASFLIVPFAANAATISLGEALGVAYETNPQLSAAQANLRGTDEEVAKANAGWRPSINAQGAWGPQQANISGFGTISAHPLQGQVTISQPLFRGGRTYAEIGRAKALVRSGRAQLTATEQSVLLDAVTAYMNVVRDEATVKLRQNNVDVLKKQRAETQERFNVGELTRTDVSQSQARLAGAQSDLIVAKGVLAASRAVFAQVIGRPPEELENMPALPQLPGTPDDALNLALQTNPALLQAREEAKAADYAVDDALGALAPSLALQGQYQYQRGGFNTLGGLPGDTGALSVTEKLTSVQAMLNVPIYQGGADEASVRQAKEFRSQAEINIVTSDRSVRQAVQTAWENFTSAQATIDSNQEQVKADTIAFEGVRREQQVGGRTTLDVLNAQQELLNSQLSVVIAQRNTVVAAYQLLASSGKLTAQNLGLKVKVYDPLQHYDDDAARWIGLD
jgi:outer membrane protein